jgi:hypothetical protein
VKNRKLEGGGGMNMQTAGGGSSILMMGDQQGAGEVGVFSASPTVVPNWLGLNQVISSWP